MCQVTRPRLLTLHALTRVHRTMDTRKWSDTTSSYPMVKKESKSGKERKREREREREKVSDCELLCYPRTRTRQGSTSTAQRQHSSTTDCTVP